MIAGFKTVLRTCAALAICVAAVGVAADAEGIGGLAKPRAAGDNTTAEKAFDKGDLPSPPSRIVIPGLKKAAVVDIQEIPDEAERVGPPDEYGEAPAEAPPPITFFGQEVMGRIVWVLDRSGSMNTMGPDDNPLPGGWTGMPSEPTKWQVVKAETIDAIMNLKPDDEFALVTFAQCPEVHWYDKLVRATEGNKEQAVSYLNRVIPTGPTPTYAALHKATHQYIFDLNAMFVLTDGMPTTGPGASAILAEFPTWWEPYQTMGTKLVGVFVGHEEGGQSFMQSLVSLTGGTFVQR